MSNSSKKLSENDLVAPPRATRKVAFAIVLLVLAVPVVLLLAPWRQNVASRGRVVAYDPVDRLQALPAPVTGRVVRTLVQEGSRVKEGEVIIEMTDLDPLFAIRLKQQVELSREKLRANRESAGFLQQQITNLEQSRDFAVTVARFEFDMAQQKVLGAQQELRAALADEEQKVADRVRKENLYRKQLRSELDVQKATRDAEAATAKVKQVQAKLEAAGHEESAKKASIDKTREDFEAKLSDVASKLEKARGEVAAQAKEVQDALRKSQIQETQDVSAPRDGIVLKINAAGKSELIKKGETLVEFVPDTDRLAAELWVKGNDAPLITPGREVRLQFEGWPAVQFVGWPSVARGTFGGIVKVVDSHGDGTGRFRILVEPDPRDVEWPEARFLRQGVQVKGWVLLEEVSLGFEIWRQLNGFPPSLEKQPELGRKKG